MLVGARVGGVVVKLSGLLVGAELVTSGAVVEPSDLLVETGVVTTGGVIVEPSGLLVGARVVESPPLPHPIREIDNGKTTVAAAKKRECAMVEISDQIPQVLSTRAA